MRGRVRRPACADLFSAVSSWGCGLETGEAGAARARRAAMLGLEANSQLMSDGPQLLGRD